MPRALSQDTMRILHLLWDLPWWTAAGLVALMGGPECISQSRVNNVLRQAQRRGWLECAPVGRELDAALRWVYTEKGIEWGESQGWERGWWHSASGVRAMARRIQAIESIERIAPNVVRSELFDDDEIYVFRWAPVIDPPPGKATTQWFLDRAYWGGASPARFHWQERGPFEVVIEYRTTDLAGPDGMPVPKESFYLPVLSLGRFHRRSSIESLRREMGELLQMRQERADLDMKYTVYGEYFPGAVAICSDGAVAAMVNRHYQETHRRRERRVNLAIMDVQGNVARSMKTPTSWWCGVKVTPNLRKVGDIGREVELLRRGAKKALNGRRPWRVFRTVATRPGSTALQISGTSKTLEAEAKGFLKAMVEVGSICLWRRGYYLATSGRDLYAGAERVTASRVLKQLGQYAVPDGLFRKMQRLHNWGSTEVCLILQEQQHQVFSALGMSIDQYVGRRLYRVAPDAYVLLPPGILVAIEYERSAKSPRAVAKKVRPYKHLASIGKPVAVLFVTETEEAADLIARERVYGVLATTRVRLEAGPLGRAVLDEQGAIGGVRGCWTYWYRNAPAPQHNAPIDLWTQSARAKLRVWEIPLGLPYQDVAPRNWWCREDPAVWVPWQPKR